jgi:hypothetical protein
MKLVGNRVGSGYVRDDGYADGGSVDSGRHGMGLITSTLRFLSSHVRPPWVIRVIY